MKIFKEFKEFAMRGNVLDMAVGIIIGAAFGKIITSLVNDVLMPPIGLLIGNVDFKQLSILLKSASNDMPAVILNYGIFINTVIDFIIVAIAIFILIRAINKFKRKQETPQAELSAPSTEILLLTEIRDILKNK
jgi:large conductance mechanosensitive channel